MPIINKKILIILVVITFIAGGVYFYLVRKRNNILPVDAQILSEDVQEKPFLTKLPIKTDNYTILYSSVKENIVVIFSRSLSSIEELKIKYQNEISLELEKIGVNQSSRDNIVWEMEK